MVEKSPNIANGEMDGTDNAVSVMCHRKEKLVSPGDHWGSAIPISRKAGVKPGPGVRQGKSGAVCGVKTGVKGKGAQKLEM